MGNYSDIHQWGLVVTATHHMLKHCDVKKKDVSANIHGFLGYVNNQVEQYPEQQIWHAVSSLKGGNKLGTVANTRNPGLGD